MSLTAGRRGGESNPHDDIDDEENKGLESRATFDCIDEDVLDMSLGASANLTRVEELSRGDGEDEEGDASSFGEFTRRF
jgi:hypothetical protein